MNIYIASDHGGFELKDVVKKYLLELNHVPVDLGADVMVPDDDYPQYAFKLAQKVAEESKNGAMGILMCRSGVGMSISANKVKGVYAALCFTRENAMKAREHNDSNVLCLDADYQDLDLHKEIIKAFIETEFGGWDSRHGRRVLQIQDFEQTHLT